MRELIWPGSGSAIITGSNLTPFGVYDADAVFQSDAPRVASWCAKRLGYPIQNIELIDENFYACFEEAISEYSAQVNQFNIIDNLDVLKGNVSDTNYTQTLVEGTNLGNVISISDGYGTLVGVGGNTDIKSGSITLVENQQVYDLDTLFFDVIETGKRADVVRVFYEGTPAISRFFDPYATGGQGTLNLMDDMGFGSFSPAAQFVLMPLYEDLLRMQAIEFNDQIRKSTYSFNIVNNKLKIYPIPTKSKKLWFEYMVREEFLQSSVNVKTGVISDYSNVGYDFIPYSLINDVGKQWIRKYTLALSKELLGAIREKYSSVPIPDGEISLDGAALRSEAQTEKDQLIEALRENLDKLSKKSQFEQRKDESEHHQEMLRKIPLAIYIG